MIVYGFSPGDKEYEYRMLKTEKDKAEWLSQQPVKQLFSPGKKLLTKYGLHTVDHAHDTDTKGTTSGIVDYKCG